MCVFLCVRHGGEGAEGVGDCAGTDPSMAYEEGWTHGSADEVNGYIIISREIFVFMEVLMNGNELFLIKITSRTLLPVALGTSSSRVSLLFISAEEIHTFNPYMLGSLLLLLRRQSATRQS